MAWLERGIKRLALQHPAVVVARERHGRRAAGRGEAADAAGVQRALTGAGAAMALQRLGASMAISRAWITSRHP